MRPELVAPPEIVYNADEAKKYTQNSRIISIQNEMTYRALELLNLPTIDGEPVPSLILDIGCGSGLSSDVLSEEGHSWVGLDISQHMLSTAQSRNIEGGDLFLQDIGEGLGFRPGSFDGCISISVLQWLCNADASHHEPRARLNRFFTTLYTSLSRGAKAVFQFYPAENQSELIVSSAMKAGFTGGIVVDYPNSAKAKKYYLVLFAGYSGGSGPALPQGLQDEQSVAYSRQRIRDNRSVGRRPVKDKDWVLRKKELARIRGRQTANDSKYTARKRNPKF